ncbi:MAG TPA: DUF1206 domain-containing protein [Thermoanaerobaculia bacterium]|nr:DUF1206 domain-containing protein [Thermoanaerobaculia bacterium]
MAQTTRGTIEQAARGVERAARTAGRPWVEPLARFGYAARGVVYALIGVLAIQAAFFGRGQTTGPAGAIETIADKSKLLLVLIAIGLLGYALWRFVQGIFDPENKGRDAKGLVQRGAMIASGVVYAGFALLAFRLFTQSGASAGAGGNQSMTAKLLSLPFGRALVILAGIGVIVSALQQMYEAYTKKFQRRMKTQEMSPDEQRLAIHTGQLGLAARGVAFLISGWFLIKAALSYDPSQAQGLGGALETLARQPSGPWLLGLVALGLVAYGAYSFLQARYRRIVF